MVCRCGHFHRKHGKSGSINFTAGECEVKGCDCSNFVIKQTELEIMSDEIGTISLCLECIHFSGEPRYVAKRNDGSPVVNSKKLNWCNEHNHDLTLIESPKGHVPDISECESFKQK